MIVTQQTTGLPHAATSDDFNYLTELIREIEHMPLKSKVLFPTENNGLIPADVTCDLKYNADLKPVAVFQFKSLQLELEMAHLAIVSYTVDGDRLAFKLEIFPNRRMRSNKHKSINSTHATARAVAQAISTNYAVGSVGRYIISSPAVKTQ